jgi:hypothetical protein
MFNLTFLKKLEQFLSLSRQVEAIYFFHMVAEVYPVFLNLGGSIGIKE